MRPSQISNELHIRKVMRAALETLAADDRLPAEQRSLAMRELNALFPDRGALIDNSKPEETWSWADTFGP